MRRSPFLLLALAALLCAGLAACGDEPGSGKPAGASSAPAYAQDGTLADGTKATSRFSVLLVCASGLRQGDAFLAGSAEPAPEEFTKFAAHATVFENAATTAGWEGPSFVSLLTGLYPKSHGIVERRDKPGGSVLIPSQVLPAEILHAQGWKTAAFTEGGFLSRGNGLEQGFAEYFDDWRPERGEVVEEWIEKAPKERPFFLLVHLPLHGAQNPAAIAARLLARWTEKAASHSPLVTIFTADCGRPLVEGKGPARGDSLGEEWIHVPLAISAPGRMAPGRAVGSCSIVDVLPTILALAGLPRPSHMDGVSLVPLAADPKSPGAPVRAHASLPASLEKTPDLFVIRTGDAKFVATNDVQARKWTEQVFDLRKDPAEKAPLPGDRAASFGPVFAKAVEDLRARLTGKNLTADDLAGKGYSAGGGY